MDITEHQAKYFAHELTRRFAPDSAEKLAGAVAGAQVTLNPHQVDAALFAFSSPLSKGALLADEVGLGKTIEAGLVIAQRWAEQKRRVLVITPSNLRNQWHQELTEKFFLPCTILETRSYNQALKSGTLRPFDQDETVIICSYQFARNKALDVQMTPWDLVVMDEAHRLRNVYKPTNVIANTLKRALAEKNKLLLTATPLQNSLLELYGLVSFIDEHTFGDLKSFREQFAGRPQDGYQLLRERLRPICHRTLRRQVTAYVQYTKRLPILEEFTPEEGEDRLYELVSDYLRRDNLQALPASQRALMTLVLRKLLASSTFAIAGALDSMSARLQAKLRKHGPAAIEAELGTDYEALETTADEWPEDSLEPLIEADRKALESEITDLNQFASLATSIQNNAKGLALLKALEAAFQKAENLGAARKAIIFTESRRTQSYLLRILADSPHADGIVLFNGTNSDEASKQIYAEWIERHQGSDRVTGSRTADMRSALVDYFRERGRIMIATEAAAEGINLQFCSLVVNYDLPWNPQRIEQRIGRCHRYGQKHDVVVVNFLNRKNEADQRVYKLLSEKFKLFEGVFGASDEVLGAVESGVDFEKRIAAIYQQCRQANEIKTAFDQLQLELSLEINEAMTQTRQKLLENFDEEVRERLKETSENSAEQLGRFERRLMHVTRHELNGDANFIDVSSFRLTSKPSWVNGGEVPLGLYELPRRSGDAHLYRLAHPLGEAVIERAKSRELKPAGVRFNYTRHAGKISLLEPFVGERGWLSASLFTVDSLDQPEDHLLVSGISANGKLLGSEACQRLLTLSGEVELFDTPASSVAEHLDASVRGEQQRIQRDVSDRNIRFFEAEADKLDGWADDLKVGLEREIKEIDRQIKEARRAAASASTLEEKLKGQKEVKRLETVRNQRRRSLFEAQDDIDRQRTTLISNIEGKLEQKTSLKHLFLVSWSIV